MAPVTIRIEDRNEEIVFVPFYPPKRKFSKSKKNGKPGTTSSNFKILNIPKSDYMRFKGIYFTVKGFCKVHWTSQHSRRVNDRTEHYTVNHDSYEEYIALKLYLLGSKHAEHHLSPGKYEYPLKFQLPATCPSSFEGSVGHVRYELRAVMDIPYAVDKEVFRDIRVFAPLDLNTLNCKEPATFEFDQTYCCWCCSSGSSETVVKLPARGFCPGQVIPIEVSCQNRSSVEIDYISFSIKKEVSYRAQHEPGHKNEEQNVLEMKKGAVPPHTDRTWVVEMSVPDMDVHNLATCSFIDVMYHFKVTVSPSGCHTDDDDTCQIFFGTVPLGVQTNTQPQAYPPAFTPFPQPIINQPVSVNQSYQPNSPFPPNPYPSNSPYPSPNPPPLSPYPGNAPYPGNSPYLGHNAPYPGNNVPYPNNASPNPPHLSPYPTNNAPYPNNPSPNPPHLSPYPPNNVPYPNNSSPNPSMTSPYPANNAPHPNNPSPVPPMASPYPNNSPYPIPHNAQNETQQSSSPYPVNKPPYPGTNPPYPASGPGNNLPYPLEDKPGFGMPGHGSSPKAPLLPPGSVPYPIGLQPSSLSSAFAGASAPAAATPDAEQKKPFDGDESNSPFNPAFMDDKKETTENK